MASVPATFPVALVGPSPDGTPGGMATVLRELLVSDVLRDAGVAFIPTWSHTEGSAATKLTTALRAIFRLVFGRGWALAHVHAASGWSIERKALLVLAARLRRKPVVLHLHGADLVEDVAQRGRLHRAIFRWSARRASCVVVLSEFWASWLAEVEPRAHAAVVRNAVPVPANVAPLVDEPTVLFLGRLGERKGIWTLLEAARTVVERVPDARFVLAGDGEVEAVRAWLAEHPAVAARTEVLGWVGADDVPALIDRSWLLALPSRNEGLPMSVLEAMARARAIVATRVGGIPDAVREGLEGLLLEPDDPAMLANHLTDLLGDRARCAAMGRAARARVADRYAIEHAMHTTLSIYEEVRTR